MNGTLTPTSELLADPEQVAAIRELYAHARSVRAVHLTYYGAGDSPMEHVWRVGNDRVSVFDGVLTYLRHGAPLLKVHVDNPRQVGQLLAAIGVLPPRFIGGGAR